MQWSSQSPHNNYITQKRISWYGYVKRREDTNVAMQVTTMKVGGKIPRGRPRLGWMDRVRSDLKQHQLDPELAQTEKHGERQSWRSTLDRDKISEGEQR